MHIKQATYDMCYVDKDIRYLQMPSVFSHINSYFYRSNACKTFLQIILALLAKNQVLRYMFAGPYLQQFRTSRAYIIAKKSKVHWFHKKNFAQSVWVGLRLVHTFFKKSLTGPKGNVQTYSNTSLSPLPMNTPFFVEEELISTKLW